MNVGEAQYVYAVNGSNYNAGRAGELLGKVWRETMRDSIREQLPRLKFMYPGTNPIFDGFLIRVYDEWDILYQIPLETSRSVLRAMAFLEGWMIDEFTDNYDHIAVRIRQKRDDETL